MINYLYPSDHRQNIYSKIYFLIALSFKILNVEALLTEVYNRVSVK